MNTNNHFISRLNGFNSLILLCISIIFISCNSSAISQNNTSSTPIDGSAINKPVRDSIINIFCIAHSKIKAKTGDTENCKYDINFIENSLVKKVKGIASSDYCIESGIILTDIISKNKTLNLEFSYYKISDFSDEHLNLYKQSLSEKEYETLTPVLKAPYSNFHFVSGNNIIILTHYATPDFYPSYDLQEYINYLKAKYK